MLCLVQWTTFLNLLKGLVTSDSPTPAETGTIETNVSELSIPEQLRKMADTLEKQAMDTT